MPFASFRSGLLAGHKTYVLAALGAASALAGWALGELSGEALVRTLLETALAAALRHGITQEVRGVPTATLVEPGDLRPGAEGDAAWPLPRLDQPPRGER